MRLKTILFFLALGAAVAQDAALDQGIRAFKNGRYPDAAANFERAVSQNPNSVTPHLYLAVAYMQQYIPGAESPENAGMAQKAEAQFQAVLALDGANKVALASLASLSLNQKKFDEARDRYRALVNVDPNNAEAYYSLAFITWSQWYPSYGKARMQLGMKPEDPGPLADNAVRIDLRSRFWGALDEAIWDLNRALQLNPQYDDAMAYMNLFIRERADLAETKDQYMREIAEADDWVQKTLATKKTRSQMPQMPQAGILGGVYTSAPPPPPPPPPPPGSHQASNGVVQFDRMQAQPAVMSKVDPVYPPLATQARVQGTVKLAVGIGEDGHVTQIQVISGHPLLVPAALEAMRRWTFQPTLLNGQPTEVMSQQEVNFTLR